MTKKKKNLTPLAIALSVIALFLAGFATYTSYNLKSNELGDEAFKASVFDAIEDYVAEKSGQPTGPVEVSLDDDPMKGDENAPVTIVEFTDYECPFCGRYVRDTMTQIVSNYIDTGKVKYVLRDFPLDMHSNAGPAANAAECVHELGGDTMYFEYHDVLFNNQEELGVDKLKEYAADFDIDQAEFAACVDEDRYAEEIKKDFQEGGSYGVRGTPAFFINGELLGGAQPYANFEKVIEEALTEAK